MNTKCLYTTLFYIVLAVVVITVIIYLRKKEGLCLCSGPQIYRKCASCVNKGGAEDLTGDVNDINQEGRPGVIKYPYDVLRWGYQSKLNENGCWPGCDP